MPSSSRGAVCTTEGWPLGHRCGDGPERPRRPAELLRDDSRSGSVIAPVRSPPFTSSRRACPQPPQTWSRVSYQGRLGDLLLPAARPPCARPRAAAPCTASRPAYVPQPAARLGLDLRGVGSAPFALLQLVDLLLQLGLLGQLLAAPRCWVRYVRSGTAMVNASAHTTIASTAACRVADMPSTSPARMRLCRQRRGAAAGRARSRSPRRPACAAAGGGPVAARLACAAPRRLRGAARPAPVGHVRPRR